MELIHPFASTFYEEGMVPGLNDHASIKLKGTITLLPHSFEIS